MSTQSFKDLKAFWYHLAKMSGFNDLESERENLKADVDLRTLNRAMADKESREGYFEQAQSYLSEIAVKGSRDYKIWALHCEGASVRAIGKKLKIHQATVQFRIKKMREKANLG